MVGIMALLVSALPFGVALILRGQEYSAMWPFDVYFGGVSADGRLWLSAPEVMIRAALLTTMLWVVGIVLLYGSRPRRRRSGIASGNDHGSA